MALLSFLRYLHVPSPSNRKIGFPSDKSVARRNPGLKSETWATHFFYFVVEKLLVRW
jgi:hypothetical protein